MNIFTNKVNHQIDRMKLLKIQNIVKLNEIYTINSPNKIVRKYCIIISESKRNIKTFKATKYRVQCVIFFTQ